MNQKGVHRPDCEKLMSTHSVPGVQDENNKALAIRIEIRIGGHMEPPVVSRFGRTVENLHFFRKRTLPKGNDFVLIGRDFARPSRPILKERVCPDSSEHLTWIRAFRRSWHT